MEGPVRRRRGTDGMSGLKLHISQRWRLSLLATFMLLIVMMITAPGVSSARAAVKLFTATITPGASAGTLTETVKNCGTPIEAPCTAASTIGLGSIEILVPLQFQPVDTTPGSLTISSPDWTVSYDPSSGTIEAQANGSNKLDSGELIDISFKPATPTTTPFCGTFTTRAWASTTNHTSGGDPFTLIGTQPTGCSFGAGQTVTDPVSGENLTGSGFVGSILASFGGNLDCSQDPTYGAQWFAYHLPNQVNLSATGSASTFTITFNATNGSDSSWYLICFSSTTLFLDRSGNSVAPGNPGILAACYDPATGTTRNAPCVSEQYRTLPMSPNPNKIVISIKVPLGDPRGH
jgi:hypothetical protein